MFIEAKGRDGVTVRNMMHVLMASNEKWIVPAGEHERRFAVFDVSDSHMQDGEWFRPIYAELEAGGYGAMLHDLLKLDLGDWHPRRIPVTAGLLDQQSQALNPEDQFWVAILDTGMIPACDPCQPDRAISGDYEVTAETERGGLRKEKKPGLFTGIRNMSPGLRWRSDHYLGHDLTKRGCRSGHKVMGKRGWQFPPLEKARADWLKRFPQWKWSNPNQVDWEGPAGSVESDDYVSEYD